MGEIRTTKGTMHVNEARGQIARVMAMKDDKWWVIGV